MWKVYPPERILTIVEIIFIAPSIDDTPDRCRLKIAKSTDPPECDCTPVRGIYIVQPDPIPCSTNTEARIRIIAGGNSQKEILFKRGNAISGAPQSKGAK